MISLKSHGNIINEVNISINTDLSKEKKKKKLHTAERIIHVDRYQSRLLYMLTSVVNRSEP